MASKKKTPKKYQATVFIYSRYERFWHWMQALLIFLLIFTGLEIHGLYTLMPYGLAVTLHDIGALLLMTLWVFTIFWNFVTGNWRQFAPFLPSRAEDGKVATAVKNMFNQVFAVARFYGWGIFKGEKHPHIKTLRSKQNDMQALAYFGFMVFMAPLIWFSGLAYLLYDFWNGGNGSQLWFQIVAFIHVLAAFIIIAFVIVHVYMTTTGETLTHYITGMFTGYEEIEIDEVEKEYLEATAPNLIKHIEEETA